MERLISRIKYRKELFTIYHPQTDERTEKTNQSVEKILRIHCNHFQNDWVKWIFMVEFNDNKTFFIPRIGFNPDTTNYGFIRERLLDTKTENISKKLRYCSNMVPNN